MLINLVNEVPALRADAELYSIDRLIHRASLIYLQIYADRYPGKSIELLHTVLNLLFAGAVKQYLADPVPRLDDEVFLDALSRALIVYSTHSEKAGQGLAQARGPHQSPPAAPPRCVGLDFDFGRSEKARAIRYISL